MNKKQLKILNRVLIGINYLLAFLCIIFMNHIFICDTLVILTVSIGIVNCVIASKTDWKL